jgi:hypothetical protein
MLALFQIPRAALPEINPPADCLAIPGVERYP